VSHSNLHTTAVLSYVHPQTSEACPRWCEVFHASQVQQTRACSPCGPNMCVHDRKHFVKTICRDDTFLKILGMQGGLARKSRRPFEAGPGPYTGHGTLFGGMGTPYGGCGVPASKAVDDLGNPLPFVALNTNSMFSGGTNCGRWVKITLKENCVGAGNDQWKPCVGGGMSLFQNTFAIITASSNLSGLVHPNQNELPCQLRIVKGSH
jgi:hypothetical protein